MESNLLDKLTKPGFNVIFNQIEHNSAITNPNELKINIGLLQASIIKMHDLAYVARLADSSVVLPVPIIVFGGRTAEKTLESFNSDKDFTNEYFKTNLIANNKLERKEGQMSGLVSLIAELYPSFGKDMKDKIASSDYELYLREVKKFKAAITNITAYSPKTTAHDSLLAKQDKIASVIDTLDFTQACKIDDRFMIDELSHFIELVNKLPEDQKTKFTSPSILSMDGRKRLSSIDLASSIIDERQGRIIKQNEIIELYNKMKSKKFIQSPAFLNKRKKDDLEVKNDSKIGNDSEVEFE